MAFQTSSLELPRTSEGNRASKTGKSVSGPVLASRRMEPYVVPPPKKYEGKSTPGIPEQTSSRPNSRLPRASENEIVQIFKESFQKELSQMLHSEEETAPSITDSNDLRSRMDEKKLFDHISFLPEGKAATIEKMMETPDYERRHLHPSSLDVKALIGKMLFPSDEEEEVSSLSDKMSEISFRPGQMAPIQPFSEEEVQFSILSDEKVESIEKWRVHVSMDQQLE